jgi:predicted metal-dependent phosphoesterase TrpH
MFGGADLHSHSTWSDGRDAPAVLASRGAAAGLSALALSDHDALRGIPDFEAACRGTGLVPVPGVELSARHAGEDAHVLGLFVDAANEGLASRLSQFRVDRVRRGEAMVERLAALGYPVDLDAIRRVVGEGSFGRPHIARAMVGSRHVADEDEAFARFLAKGGPAWLPKPKWGLGEAIGAVRAAGGLAVLAHPVWHRDPEATIRAARDAGLDGLEVRHSDHAPADEARFRDIAAGLGLFPTAGSDSHGSQEGQKQVGACRLGQEDWENLVAAAAERRAEAGLPPPDLRPR